MNRTERKEPKKSDCELSDQETILLLSLQRAKSCRLTHEIVGKKSATDPIPNNGN